MIFNTNNSTYVINAEKKTITGGIFGNTPYAYTKYSAIIGKPAVIELTDGRVVITSKVVSYGHSICR